MSVIDPIDTSSFVPDETIIFLDCDYSLWVLRYHQEFNLTLYCSWSIIYLKTGFKFWTNIRHVKEDIILTLFICIIDRIESTTEELDTSLSVILSFPVPLRRL